MPNRYWRRKYSESKFEPRLSSPRCAIRRSRNLRRRPYLPSSPGRRAGGSRGVNSLHRRATLPLPRRSRIAHAEATTSNPTPRWLSVSPQRRARRAYRSGRDGAVGQARRRAGTSRRTPPASSSLPYDQRDTPLRRLLSRRGAANRLRSRGAVSGADGGGGGGGWGGGGGGRARPSARGGSRRWTARSCRFLQPIPYDTSRGSKSFVGMSETLLSSGKRPDLYSPTPSPKKKNEKPCIPGGGFRAGRRVSSRATGRMPRAFEHKLDSWGLTARYSMSSRSKPGHPRAAGIRDT